MEQIYIWEVGGGWCFHIIRIRLPKFNLLSILCPSKLSYATLCFLKTVPSATLVLWYRLKVFTNRVYTEGTVFTKPDVYKNIKTYSNNYSSMYFESCKTISLLYIQQICISKVFSIIKYFWIPFFNILRIFLFFILHQVKWIRTVCRYSGIICG